MPLPWQKALGVVFLSGAAFVILTLTRIRRRIIEAIGEHPMALYLRAFMLRNTPAAASNSVAELALGMMLALARKIVEEHQGTIRVEPGHEHHQLVPAVTGHHILLVRLLAQQPRRAQQQRCRRRRGQRTGEDQADQEVVVLAGGVTNVTLPPAIEPAPGRYVKEQATQEA